MSSIIFLKGVFLISFLLIISIIDFRTKMIYDKILFPMLIIGICFLPCTDNSPLSTVSCAICYSLLLLVLRMITKGGMGGGDIKFAFVLGIWLGFPATLPAVLLAFWSGALFAFIFLIPYGVSRKQQIPFAPFMSFGALISFFLLNQIIEIYRSLIYG